jgi:hypothetical protein
MMTYQNDYRCSRRRRIYSNLKKAIRYIVFHSYSHHIDRVATLIFLAGSTLIFSRRSRHFFKVGYGLCVRSFMKMNLLKKTA